MASILPRRAFLGGFGAAGLGLWPRFSFAQENLPTTQEELSRTQGGQAIARTRQNRPWRIAAINGNTKETLNIVYRMGNTYSQTGLRSIAYFMRDWRENQARYMDPRLVDLLAYIHQASGSTEPIWITSGYRTPKTNAMLVRTVDAATNSYHMVGMAADVRMPGIPTRWIRDAGLYLGIGGVGYYPRSDFVHLDTGPVRRWGA